MKIFAYGSNMCTARLRARVPSARPVAIARLPGHTLRFHKPGWRDGSGKCDACPADESGAELWGVVFDIDEREKPDLDRIEGLGHGYDEKRVTVIDPDGRTHTAWMYCADPAGIDEDAVPFDWYRDLVLAGALEHGLPEGHVRGHITPVTVRPDSDRERAALHRALLDRQPA